MSTTTCQSDHSSKLFVRRNIRTSSAINAMANEHSRFPLGVNHLRTPIPPIGEPLLINSNRIKPSVSTQNLTTRRQHFEANEGISVNSSKRIYTFCNPPRELLRNPRSSNNSLLHQRISSAPDENSPRSRLNQPKSFSANESLTSRARGERNPHSIRTIDSTNRHLKRDEQQKDSLNDLLKVQEKSKVPKAVQKRRIIVLFPRSSTKQEQNILPISNNNHIPIQENPIVPSQIVPSPPTLPTAIPNSAQIIGPSDSLDNSEPEMADSLELAAILAEIQFEKDWTPNHSSSTSKGQQSTTLDSKKYEYDVTNLLDTATFKLSPRTLKPDEQLAARKRFSQYHLNEMRSSANAKIPSLIASIVTESNSTMGNGTDNGPTFTVKLNATDSMKKQNSLDDDDSLEATIDSELVQLCYDATLKLLYDPKTGKYYDLKST